MRIIKRKWLEKAMHYGDCPFTKKNTQKLTIQNRFLLALIDNDIEAKVEKKLFYYDSQTIVNSSAQ